MFCKAGLANGYFHLAKGSRRNVNAVRLTDPANGIDSVSSIFGKPILQLQIINYKLSQL